MKIEPLALEGCFVLKPERSEDERGFFARVFCVDELRRHGLEASVNQASISFNAKRGTLRGMHYQAAPHEEVKVVRCTSGAAYDVAVDLREGSATYRKWCAVELSAANRVSVYLPKGVAHGFLTLTDDVELAYLISESHAPGAGRGIRWSDPAVGVDWPFDPVVISDRDKSWPLLG